MVHMYQYMKNMRILHLAPSFKISGTHSNFELVGRSPRLTTAFFALCNMCTMLEKAMCLIVFTENTGTHSKLEVAGRSQRLLVALAVFCNICILLEKPVFLKLCFYPSLREHSHAK